MDQVGTQWFVRAHLAHVYDRLLPELDEQVRRTASLHGVAGELCGPIREPWRDTAAALAYRWQTLREGEVPPAVVPLGDDEGTAGHDHHDDEGGNA